MCSAPDDTITDANNRLSEIPGIVPSIREFGSNKCPFASRCKYQMEQCWAERPGLTQISEQVFMHAGKERQLTANEQTTHFESSQFTQNLQQNQVFFRAKKLSESRRWDFFGH